MDQYTAFFVLPMVYSIPEATRNDYFRLVYNWYMASWYTYNDLIFCCDEDVSRSKSSLLEWEVTSTQITSAHNTNNQSADSIVQEMTINKISVGDKLH